MVDQPRLTSRLLVDGLRRRVQAAGGYATILQRGNDQAGAILIECREHGQITTILEKYSDMDGRIGWRPVEFAHAAPAKYAENYGQKRAASDPDLWWIELDVADAARFTDDWPPVD
jgi:hypothetical protein